MARGEQRSNREAKKPKKEKIKVIAAAPSQKGAGWQPTVSSDKRSNDGCPLVGAGPHFRTRRPHQPDGGAAHWPAAVPAAMEPILSAWIRTLVCGCG